MRREPRRKTKSKKADGSQSSLVSHRGVVLGVVEISDGGLFIVRIRLFWLYRPKLLSKCVTN